MLKKDTLYCRDPQLLKRHPMLQSKMRSILLDWMTEVSVRLKLKSENKHVMLGRSLLPCAGFVRGLKNLKCFGNLSLLVPGLEVLEIWENLIKSHGYWHFGHGDFIFQSLMFI
jgi:hypothetical protein